MGSMTTPVLPTPPRDVTDFWYPVSPNACFRVRWPAIIARIERHADGWRCKVHGEYVGETHASADEAREYVDRRIAEVDSNAAI